MTLKTAAQTTESHGTTRKPSCCTRRADHLFGDARVMRNSFSSVSFRAFPWFKCFFRDDANGIPVADRPVPLRHRSAQALRRRSVDQRRPRLPQFVVVRGYPAKSLSLILLCPEE
jgi:hypothetical protein